MPPVTRRSFVAWAGGLAAALGFGRRAGAASATSATRAGSTDDAGHPASSESAPPFPPATLQALATAVLPGELGADGAGAAARRFSEWIAAYRPGAEALHGYGTGEIVLLPPSPLRRWRAQLAALDDAARAGGHAGLTARSVAERQTIVREALAGTKVGRLGDPLSAPHVVVALLAHWYASPDATDACYGVAIGRQQCRPLVNAVRPPLPLARGAGR